MKKYVLFIIILISLSCGREPSYKIIGTITDVNTIDIKLLKYSDGEFHQIDSVRTSNGEFTFTGKVKNPDRFHIQLNDEPGYNGFFLENSIIEFNIDIESPTPFSVNGSITHELYEQFEEKFQSDYSRSIDSIKNLYKYIEDDIEEKILDSLLNSKIEESINFVIDFSRIHPKSVVAPYLAYRYSYKIPEFDYNDLLAVKNNIYSQVFSSASYKIFEKRVKKLGISAIGKPSIDFLMNDTLGNPISLLSINSEYILIDFWGSICTPCRKQHPNLRKVYNKYKPKGFEILGVSLDDNRKDWINAINKDKINWLQVSSLTGWNNEAVDIYNIAFVPQNVLIDGKRRIIAKNLNPRELEIYLGEIFE